MAGSFRGIQKHPLRQLGYWFPRRLGGKHTPIRAFGLYMARRTVALKEYCLAYRGNTGRATCLHQPERGDRVHPDFLSLPHRFTERYLRRNTRCLLRCFSLVGNWGICKQMVFGLARGQRGH